MDTFNVNKGVHSVAKANTMIKDGVCAHLVELAGEHDRVVAVAGMNR